VLLCGPAVQSRGVLLYINMTESVVRTIITETLSPEFTWTLPTLSNMHLIETNYKFKLLPSAFTRYNDIRYYKQPFICLQDIIIEGLPKHRKSPQISKSVLSRLSFF